MSRMEVFSGPLADVMADFVSFKRMQGYDYCSQAKALERFDRFLLEQECPGALLRHEHFERYVVLTEGLSAGWRETLLSVVREFSRYLNCHDPKSVVVPQRLLPRHRRRRRFYRMEPAQIRSLMDAAIVLNMRHPVGPQAIRFLIGLLYCTGLRISEALKLNLGDLDLGNGTIFVRKGKFGKDRLVALAESTTVEINRWLKLRSGYAGDGPSSPLLIASANGRLTYTLAKQRFVGLCKDCGLDGKPAPRLHDLRHNFACSCIARWRNEGRDTQTLLPVLANAMGHVNIFATQIYIHMEAAAFDHASAQFHRQFIQQQKED